MTTIDTARDAGSQPAALRLNAGERESFFAATARHRRAAWQVSAACGTAALLLALTASALMAPLVYCVIGLAVDVANLAVPMPDLLGALGRMLDPVLDGHAGSAGQLLQIALLAALPGLLLMGAILLSLRRTVRASLQLGTEMGPPRAPDRTVLAEQRLTNVVEEMALAAAIPVPRILLVPGGSNAAAIGDDDAHTTILFGSALLERLPRAQMQGVAAHLVAAIADGDIRVGRQAATVLALFGLLASLSTAFGERRIFSHARSLLRALLRPSSTHALDTLRDAMDPFSTPAGATAARPPTATDDLTWREWAAMPLAGPVVLSGFICGLVSSFLLGPLVSIVWRRRKYMADATSVRLTREPDTLAAALAAVGGHGAGIPPWFAHLAFVGSGPAGGRLSAAQVLSMFPPPERRGRALVRLGAHTVPLASPAVLSPARLMLVAGLGTLAGALMVVATFLLVFVATAVSMFFTVMPAALLHALLRAIGH
jgi:Zn-dependent protease with chaperone function